LYAVADNGSLAYVPGIAGNNRLVSWMTRDGKRQMLLDKPQTYLNPSLSPDGRRLALQIASTDAEDDIWLYDIGTKVFSRLTFGGGRHTNPLWTPDGRRIIYAQGKVADRVRNLYWMTADGADKAERLTDAPYLQTPSDVTPDGRTLMFGQIDNEGRAVLWTMLLLGDRTPRLYLDTATNNRADAEFAGGKARFSPDGRWVAYPSSESGPLEVYVRAFPGPGGKWQVSTGGGLVPLWSRSGKELFFVANGAITAVDVQAGASFSHGEPRRLFTYNAPAFSDYSVTSDGRFVLLTTADAANAAEVHVTVNWADELKRRTSAAR
jgi:serine/threonine-protein kinase